MAVYEKIFGNNRLKSNATQLYFILVGAELHCNFSIVTSDDSGITRSPTVNMAAFKSVNNQNWILIVTLYLNFRCCSRGNLDSNATWLGNYANKTQSD